MEGDLKALDKEVVDSAEAFNEQDIISTVDGLGLDCPEPLMLLRRTLRNIESGEIVALLSDDPVSLRDVPALCSFMNHELLQMPNEKYPHRFVIRKG